MQSSESHKNIPSARLAVRTSLEVCLRLNEIFLIEGSDDIVKARNHLCWVIDQLEIKLPIELPNMFPFNFEGAPNALQLVQTDTIDLFANELALHHFSLFELEYELFDRGQHLRSRYGGAVEDTTFRF